MIISDINVSLKGFEIGISGAVPDRSEWDEPAQDRAILEFISLLSGLIFKYGGRVVHGSHPTFTPVILHQAQIHADKHLLKPSVTLLMSDLWAKDLDDYERDYYQRIAEFITVPKIGDGGPEDPQTRNSSLSKMRQQLAQRMNVLIAVGGKQHHSDGLIPGVAEELSLARDQRVPCFLVGGFGGMTGILAKQGEEKLGDLGNELPPQTHVELLRTKDIVASISIIFDHLARNPHLKRHSYFKPETEEEGCGA